MNKRTVKHWEAKTMREQVMSELQQVKIDVTTSRVEEFIREWEAVNRPIEFTLRLGRTTRVVVLARSRGEVEELLSVWREVCHGRARVVGTKDEEAKRDIFILRQRFSDRLRKESK